MSNPSQPFKKSLITPKFGSVKIVFFIAFIISLTLEVQIVWFCCQKTICVTKQQKMQFFGIVNFKSSTLAVHCLSSLFIYIPITETIFNILYPLGTHSSIMISGTQIYSIVFLPWVTEHAVEWNFLKMWVLSSLLFKRNF